jgi:hypothetical protein
VARGVGTGHVERTENGADIGPDRKRDVSTERHLDAPKSAPTSGPGILHATGIAVASDPHRRERCSEPDVQIDGRSEGDAFGQSEADLEPAGRSRYGAQIRATGEPRSAKGEAGTRAEAQRRICVGTYEPGVRNANRRGASAAGPRQAAVDRNRRVGNRWNMRDAPLATCRSNLEKTALSQLTRELRRRERNATGFEALSASGRDGTRSVRPPELPQLHSQRLAGSEEDPEIERRPAGHARRRGHFDICGFERDQPLGDAPVDNVRNFGVDLQDRPSACLATLSGGREVSA